MVGRRGFVGLALTGAALVAGSAIAVAAPKDGTGGGKGGGGSSSDVVPSITLNQTARLAGELQIGDNVTYTTVIAGLQGSEWPMVYTECQSDADGSVVYGQLDYPDATFVLGGGSSPWLLVRGGATCDAALLAYGGKAKGVDTIRVLATTEPFHVGS